jgi:enamine deaminase RidA (YjgF/YER057c/UK114 family)
MTGVRRLSSGRPWEEVFQYSRAVVYGGVFESCLTSPSDPDGRIVAPGDVYGQTRRCLDILRDVLDQAGFAPASVVSSTVYMLDTRCWEDAGRAHREVFGLARPALSFLGCANFWHPDILVEVAIRAYAPHETTTGDPR